MAIHLTESVNAVARNWPCCARQYHMTNTRTSTMTHWSGTRRPRFDVEIDLRFDICNEKMLVMITQSATKHAGDPREAKVDLNSTHSSSSSPSHDYGRHIQSAVPSMLSISSTVGSLILLRKEKYFFREFSWFLPCFISDSQSITWSAEWVLLGPVRWGSGIMRMGLLFIAESISPFCWVVCAFYPFIANVFLFRIFPSCVISLCLKFTYNSMPPS